MIQSDIDLEPFHLLGEPAHDADHVAPPRGLRRKHHLPAEFTRRLEQNHAMAARGGHTGGFEASRPAAGHHDALGLARRPRDPVRKLQFPSGGHIVDAQRVPSR